jgi:hypothetical protein
MCFSQRPLASSKVNSEGAVTVSVLTYQLVMQKRFDAGGSHPARAAVAPPRQARASGTPLRRPPSLLPRQRRGGPQGRDGAALRPQARLLFPGGRRATP